MKMRLFLSILVVILTPFSSFADSKHPLTSYYAGQEKREIKSLSESDIDELKNGRGWGLAKAAELNGVPGPSHLLEMKKEINLTPDQIEKIELIYQEMKEKSIPLGLKLIELERELNNHFSNRSITDDLLQELLEKIAQVHKKLRYVHLSAHLKTPDIVTPKQIELYNKLRGYFSDDPCQNIPEGHDPEMWKKHNDCP